MKTITANDNKNIFRDGFINNYQIITSLSILKKAILLVIIFLFGVYVVSAQDNRSASHTITILPPPMAMLQVESSTQVALTNNHQLQTTFERNNKRASSTKMTISSVVIQNTNTTRYIYAQITRGNLPVGMQLKLQTVNQNQNAGEESGKTIQELVLSNYAKNVISGMGTCFTGNGNNAGFDLKYSVAQATNQQTNYINAQNALTVTYTFSD